MDPLENFLAHFDLTQLLFLLLSAVASLLCITFHELSHGWAAWRLGDMTAKNMGRLTLNPLAHVDLVGFVMMLIAHVGWAKPVPVDMRNFRHPKRDMAITALAGPISNLVLAAVVLGVGSLVYHFAPIWDFVPYLLLFVCYVAVLSVGLGLFNLIPIPPLDGSKVLSALLPDRIYYQYMRYEQFLLLLVVALAWFGVFAGPLDVCIGWVLRGMCAVTGFPFWLIQYYFGF